MKISFERGHSKRRLAGGNLKPPGPAAGHLQSSPLNPSASAARSGFFWHPPITLQAGGWSSPACVFPKLSKRLSLWGAATAVYCTSTRKKHCGVTLMLLVTATIPSVPAKGVPKGVQVVVRQVVYSS